MLTVKADIIGIHADSNVTSEFVYVTPNSFMQYVYKQFYEYTDEQYFNKIYTILPYSKAKELHSVFNLIRTKKIKRKHLIF